MGNTAKSNGADNDFYRRPTDGVEPQWEQQPAVQVIDDGAGPGSAAGPATDLRPGPAAAPRVSDHDEPAQGLPAPPRRRINYFFATAWALVGLLLALGLSWLTGAFSKGQYFVVDPGSPNVDAPSAIVINLQSMGPVPLVLGLFGAFTLLVVQGSALRRGS